MQRMRAPKTARRTLHLQGAGDIIIVAVEPESSAARVGLLISGVLVALDRMSVSETADVEGTRASGNHSRRFHYLRALAERANTVGEDPTSRVSWQA
jgi:hypothetical protein